MQVLIIVLILILLLLKVDGLFILNVQGIFEKMKIILRKLPTHVYSHSSYGWINMIKNFGLKALYIVFNFQFLVLSS